MTETKTPQAGEYWLSGSSLIAYVVGFTIDGDPAWQQKGSRQILSDEMQFFLACFHHEPRCDSFDWVEPAVKRVPVRLFLDHRNNMFAVRGEWPIVVGTQIKHDAGGFYVEGE